MVEFDGTEPRSFGGYWSKPLSSESLSHCWVDAISLTDALCKLSGVCPAFFSSI